MAGIRKWFGYGDNGGTITRRYTHRGSVDEPLQVETFDIAGVFDTRYTYHADHLGSIRFLTDTAGNVVNSYDYDSYGRPVIEVETFAQPYRFTGREWDAAAQLYYYRARNYDPDTGRFIQEDPIGLLIGTDHSQRYKHLLPAGRSISEGFDEASQIGFGPDFNLSLYRYVNNNPTNLIDPSGLLGINYSSFIQKQSAAIRTIDFHARKILKLLPKKAGRTFDPRNGQFTGSAAKQAAARKRAIAATKKCLEETLQSPTAESSAGFAFGALLFCGTVGVLAGALG